MFLRAKVRRKDGKEHRYWSVVENRRVGGGRVAQRHVRVRPVSPLWRQRWELGDSFHYR